MARTNTQIIIIGAGPAGLVLGRLLQLAGTDAVILEARSRAHVEGRIRAGILEHDVAKDLGRDRRRRPDAGPGHGP